MNFGDLLHIVGDEPVFESGLLLAGEADERDVRKQLSRWTLTGKLIQLRRGLYALASPHQKITPHPFLIANHLVHGSYVSCESALAHYNIIPERVPLTISVSLSRPVNSETPLGRFLFHHISGKLHFGYQPIVCTPGQQVMVATPEKALLDLVHYKKQGDQHLYLQSLRLQHLDQLNKDRLIGYAQRAGSPKLMRAAGVICDMIKKEIQEYRTL